MLRNILVPLTGQYETMFLRDVHLLKVDILKKIPEGSKDSFLTNAAALFLDEKSKAD